MYAIKHTRTCARMHTHTFFLSFTTSTPLRITVYFLLVFPPFFLSVFSSVYIYLTRGCTRNIFYFTFSWTKTSFSRTFFPSVNHYSPWQWLTNHIFTIIEIITIITQTQSLKEDRRNWYLWKHWRSSCWSRCWQHTSQCIYWASWPPETQTCWPKLSVCFLSKHHPASLGKTEGSNQCVCTMWH